MADQGTGGLDVLVSGRMSLGVVDVLQAVDVTDDDAKGVVGVLGIDLTLQ